MNLTGPALRYHGGKFRLAPWLIEHFPPHKCYVEPFGGAAGVLIQKPRAYAEVYNDIDGDIVNFFQVVREPSTRARLIEALACTPYAREEFNAAFTETEDPIERARRTCIRAQMGFGSAGATKGTTGFRIDTHRSYGTSQSLWARYPESISALGDRFAGVLIENRPAIEVIDQHDGPDTLFYVDPPYMHETRYRNARHGHYYRHEMNDADHTALLEKLLDVRGMVVLSGYASDTYDDFLTDWTRGETEARIASNRGTTVRTESIWLNPACAGALYGKGLFAEVGA